MTSPEALASISTTTDILRRVVIGSDTNSGIADRTGRASVCRKRIVCDASILRANPGVNPSPAIAALAERIMTTLPSAAAVRSTDCPTFIRLQQEN
jgi:choline dehydrogenase-like flavoprotein